MEEEKAVVDKRSVTGGKEEALAAGTLKPKAEPVEGEPGAAPAVALNHKGRRQQEKAKRQHEEEVKRKLAAPAPVGQLLLLENNIRNNFNNMGRRVDQAIAIGQGAWRAFDILKEFLAKKEIIDGPEFESFFEAGWKLRVEKEKADREANAEKQKVIAEVAGKLRAAQDKLAGLGDSIPLPQEAVDLKAEIEGHIVTLKELGVEFKDETAPPAPPAEGPTP